MSVRISLNGRRYEEDGYEEEGGRGGEGDHEGLDGGVDPEAKRPRLNW